MKETGDPKQTYRNGYKPRALKIKIDELLLNKPQFRYHPFTEYCVLYDTPIPLTMTQQISAEMIHEFGSTSIFL